MTVDCPACAVPLVPRRVDEVRFEGCPSCGGIAVDALQSLRLWAALAASGEPLPEPVPAARAERCARCGQGLEDLEYLGSPEVKLRRCPSCSLLWIPADRQEGARRLWSRRQQHEASREESRADLEAAFRPVRHTVAGIKHSRTAVGGDPDAEVEWLRAERERDRHRR